MKNYLKARISNYNICIDKIQNAIDECVKNDLWDEVSSLEAIRNKIMNLVDEDKIARLELNKK